MSDGFQLAQLNIGRSRGPMDAPTMADFMSGLAPINALAESSPGFVWRLQTDSGNATSIQAGNYGRFRELSMRSRLK